MSLKSKLMDFLAGIEDDETGVADAVTDETATDAKAVTDPLESPDIRDNSEPATGVDSETGGDESGDGEEGETLGGSEVSEAELRDSLVNLGAENERLRNMVIDLGGDPEAEPEIETEELDADTEDEYDDDAAEADIADQQKQIAALLGN